MAATGDYTAVLPQKLYEKKVSKQLGDWYSKVVIIFAT
jgi:hypothetical protein